MLAQSSSMSPLESLGDISRLLPEIDTPTKAYTVQRVQSPTTGSQSLPIEASPSNASIPALLFRMFSERSAGENSPRKFRASDFLDVKRISTPPPLSNSYFLTRLASHYRRRQLGSPVISTTDSLVWVIHKAIQEQNALREGNQTRECSKIAVIMSSDIQSRIYSGREAYSELKRIPGAVPVQHRKFKSASEYLIWGEIPGVAISKTISLDELYKKTQECPALDRLLRLNVLESFKRLFPALKQFTANPVALDSTTAIGFAKLLIFFNITPAIPGQIISAGICRIINGWILKICREEDIRDAFDLWVFQFFKVNLVEDTVSMEEA
jgi:hypothetical protein